MKINKGDILKINGNEFQVLENWTRVLINSRVEKKVGLI